MELVWTACSTYVPDYFLALNIYRHCQLCVLLLTTTHLQFFTQIHFSTQMSCPCVLLNNMVHIRIEKVSKSGLFFNCTGNNTWRMSLQHRLTEAIHLPLQQQRGSGGRRDRGEGTQGRQEKKCCFYGSTCTDWSFNIYTVKLIKSFWAYKWPYF